MEELITAVYDISWIGTGSNKVVKVIGNLNVDPKIVSSITVSDIRTGYSDAYSSIEVYKVLVPYDPLDKIYDNIYMQVMGLKVGTFAEAFTSKTAVILDSDMGDKITDLAKTRGKPLAVFHPFSEDLCGWKCELRVVDGAPQILVIVADIDSYREREYALNKIEKSTITGKVPEGSGENITGTIYSQWFTKNADLLALEIPLRNYYINKEGMPEGVAYLSALATIKNTIIRQSQGKEVLLPDTIKNMYNSTKVEAKVQEQTQKKRIYNTLREKFRGLAEMKSASKKEKLRELDLIKMNQFDIKYRYAQLGIMAYYITGLHFKLELLYDKTKTA